MTLLELQYGGRIQNTQVAREWAGESGISVRESEHSMDVGLFLDEYPQWELGTLHQLVILHEIFLQAVKRGRKEGEYMVCQGHWYTMCEPNPKVGQPAMKLVGYCMTQKEIRDTYQGIYLLWRSPGLPSCGDQLRRRAIQDILSSLKDQLHRWGHPATTEDQELQEQRWSRPNRQESYKEALRVAHQRALDTTEALQSNIERLSWRGRERSWTRSITCSRTHSRSWSRSHSRSRSQSRSCRMAVARIISRAAHRIYGQGPLTDLHLGGG